MYLKFSEMEQERKRRNNKDVFSKVEKEAKNFLNDPEKKGAARTVLEFIEEQRKREQHINKH